MELDLNAVIITIVVVAVIWAIARILQPLRPSRPFVLFWWTVLIGLAICAGVLRYAGS